MICQLLVYLDLKNNISENRSYVTKTYKNYTNQPVGAGVKDIAMGEVGLEFDYRAGQIRRCRQRLATAATSILPIR